MTPSNNASLFFLWLGISMLMSLGALAALIWAIRAGQFSDQQRARYLALFSKTPGEEKSTGNEVKGDRKERESKDVS